MELRNRIAVVTGAGSGIGRALARTFARAGMKVVCVGRRAERLEETRAMIEAEGSSALAIPADVTNWDDVRRMTALTLEKWERIDLVFNNAGSFRTIAPVHDTNPEMWWTDVTVNLRGGYLVARQALRHMLARNEGVIINMDGGRPAGGTGYACGKAGLMELTRLMAEELRLMHSSVMVFSAHPGLVRTEMTDLQAHTADGQKWIPSTYRSFDAGGTRAPEEIAEATIRLLRVARPEMSGLRYDPDADFSRYET